MISTLLNKQSKTNYSPMVNMSSSNHSITPRSLNLPGSYSQHHHAPSTTATLPVTRSTINDFREIIREQSFIIPTHSSSDHHHHHHHQLDVPIKKYPPLPDISVANNTSPMNTFFRTESILTPPKQTPPPKKQMFYHFAAPAQRGHLPALHNRHHLPITTLNAMDLDEDLPQYHSTIAHRAATYTSPGDRVISPIKRPSAPSPPTSAQIKRPGQNAFVYGEEDQDEEEEEDEENYSVLDDDDSQVFNEHFSRYHQQQQPIIMHHRRIDHYNPNNRYYNIHERQNTLIITDEPTHPLDSIEFES